LGPVPAGAGSSYARTGSPELAWPIADWPAPLCIDPVARISIGATGVELPGVWAAANTGVAMARASKAPKRRLLL
jgi:hypothetical protein